MNTELLIQQIEASIKHMDDVLLLPLSLNPLNRLNETMNYAKGLVTGISLADGIDLSMSTKYHTLITENYLSLSETVKSNIAANSQIDVIK